MAVPFPAFVESSRATLQRRHRFTWFFQRDSRFLPSALSSHALLHVLSPNSSSGHAKSVRMIPADRKNRDHDPWRERDHGSLPWGFLLFGLIGATATTIAVGKLRRTVDWFSSQLNRSRSYSSWRNATGSSNPGSYREEAWNRYNRRMQEEYEEEMERVERIKRVQSVFNRERNKYKKSYETWRDPGPGAHQHFQRDDWYWKTDASYKDQRTNFRFTPRENANYLMSHHYSILGLDRSRSAPYSDAEIKTAFRAKAMEYHPDQNRDNKEAAEAKFKEVMMSYEAIKLERKGGRCY